MSDLSHETRKLIAMAREGDPIPPGRRALIESKLFTRVAGGALIGLAAREAWAHSAGLFSTLAKGVAGLALLSSVGAGGYFAVRAVRNETTPVHSTFLASRPPPQPTEPSQPRAEALLAPTNETPPPANPIANPIEVPRPTIAPPSRDVPSRRAAPALVAKASGASSRAAGSAPRAQTSSRSAMATTAQAAPAQVAAPAQTAPPPEQATVQPPEDATPARPPSTLADETRLLWEADQALRSGKTSRAVALLDEHMSRYPEGALGPERGAERVVALCKLGRIDAATVRSYLTSHPNLPLADRIQQTCAPILSRGK